MIMIKLIKNALRYFNIAKGISKINIGENLEDISFECDQCGEVFSSEDLFSAMFSYGLIFLIGKGYGYIGMVCPKCRKTTLKKGDRNIIESLKDQLSSKVGYVEGSDKSKLRYYSFPYSLDYHQENIPNPIGSYMKPLSEGSDSLEESEVDHLFANDSSGLSEGYCSYFFGDLAIGPAIAVWWFKEEDIEALVKIENKTGLKVFPRYTAYHSFPETISTFCWKYHLESDFINKLDLSAFPGIIVPETEVSSKQKEKNSDFLNILNISPYQPDRSFAPPSNSSLDVIQPTSQKSIDKHATVKNKDSHEDMVNALWEDFDKESVQKKLSTLSNRFIYEYIELAQNNDFLFGGLWAFKEKHLKNIYRQIDDYRDDVDACSFDTMEEDGVEFHLSADIESDGEVECLKMEEEYISEKALRKEVPQDLVSEPELHIDLEEDIKLDKGIYELTGEEITLQKESEEVALKEVTVPAKKSVRDQVKIARKAQKDIPEKLSTLEKKFSNLEKIITQNRELMELKYKVAEVAKFDTDMLVVGETGTGKELFARAIHEASERKGNFVPINCAGIPKDLFESELFGHKKGSFTGAISDKIGAFEYAHHGTLFLDELGEMPIELQPKVLRAIEYREVKPVGSAKSVNVDAKLVFASNRDLKKEVEFGNFRKDLFFRIFSPSFRIRPLRERVEDIALLADHFRKYFNKKFNKQVKSISPNVITKLKDHPWEGNVRELMKGIEMAVINSTGPVITENELPDFLKEEEMEEENKREEELPPATKITNDEIRYWMKKLNNNKSQVAEKLGVTYRTILRRCRNLNL